MKIACLAHYYIEENRAGGEMMMHGLLKALLAAGHDITVLVTDTGRPNSEVDGIKVHYAMKPELALQTINPDIVITHFQNGPPALKYAKLYKKPLVYVVHNDVAQTMSMIQSLRREDLVVFNTNWIKNKARGSALYVVVRPPIDREGVKTDKKGKYVTLVNLTEPKGVDLFFELARQMPHVQFLGVKGGYWKEHQKTMNLKNLKIIDMTSNMRDDVYAQSKVILMPSSYETFGMVAAEAISNGIPVISTRTVGLEENLADAGIYISRDKSMIPAWKAEIDRLLTDEDYYKEMSEKVLERSKVIDTEAELNEFVKMVEKLKK